MVNPQIGDRITYIHPGRESGPAPGMPLLMIGIDYTIASVRHFKTNRETWWITIAGPDGQMLPYEFDYTVFDRAYPKGG